MTTVIRQRRESAVPGVVVAKPDLSSPTTAWRVVGDSAAWICREAARDRRVGQLNHTTGLLLEALAAVGIRVTPPVPRRPRPKPLCFRLSQAELDVCERMSLGMTNLQIGAELSISEDTVKTRARMLYRKLGAHDRAHAVAIAFRTGLIR
ncbi:regulatory LuxR family protein [Stackebrandtia albiflava]|uniref:Regulatory LuxR family protein n=1 Tax=Stackebrandtia albiflava TaxID=406432 RepID=A0A562VCI5_9ACTN|nr:regulatory LuxR family protein [Stackebrandtia albiflava]